MFTMRAALIAAVLLGPAAAQAATFLLNALPAGWEAAQSTPGRQIVGGEPSITFDVATDVFTIDPSTFNITEIRFANDLAANLPASANVIVLQDAGLNAGLAANAIATQVSATEPGFFVYFNAGLNLPRLVYSADLSDNTADLAVLARLTNLTGQPTALPTFTAANFSLFSPSAIPTLSDSMVMAMAALLGIAAIRKLRAG